MIEPRPRSAYHASDGAAYEWFLGRWTARLAEPLLDFARFATSGELLEVGCGTGSLARAMAQRWPARRVVGIDLAEPYIAHARAHVAGANPTFDIGDAGALPYAAGRFA